MFTLFVEYHPSKLFISIQTFGKMCSVYNTLIKVSHVFFIYIFIVFFYFFPYLFSFFCSFFFPLTTESTTIHDVSSKARELHLMSGPTATRCQLVRNCRSESLGTTAAMVHYHKRRWVSLLQLHFGKNC